ncbi:MAG TPA: phage holin family protein [Candidatus Udaeobacter sp.]|nr:phage holin family protein [Candidatus Udaeobacter sp.]
MSSESPISRNPAGHPGLLGNALALLGAVADFFESRLALAVQESKSAGVQILILIVCLVVAASLCVMGYVFLIVSAIVGLAHLAGTSWPWIALIVGLMHFIIALVLLVIARSRINKPMFRDTVDELKKDREWLKNLNRSTS